MKRRGRGRERERERIESIKDGARDSLVRLLVSTLSVETRANDQGNTITAGTYIRENV